MGKHHKTIEKLDKVANEIRHFPKGKKISELAEKLGMPRSTLYDYINTLELMGRAYYQRGTAYPRSPKESIQPEAPAFEETKQPARAENIEFESSQDYEIALEHSKALLNGFPFITKATVLPGPSGKSPYIARAAVPHEFFGPYRELAEKMRSLEPSKIKDYVDGLCADCEHVPTKPPALPRICLNCQGSLYDSVMEKLKPYVECSELPAKISSFLYYEYKSELYVLSYKALKDGFETMRNRPEEWWSLYNYIRERMSAMGFVDTVDGDMPRMLEQLLSIGRKEAEQALRLSMDVVKWHVIIGSSENPRALKPYQKAYEEYYKIARHALNKARQKKSPIKQILTASGENLTNHANTRYSNNPPGSQK